jgi:hypothetical protein
MIGAIRIDDMIRGILAVVLGVIAGGVFNMALVTLSNAVYPLPEGVDPNDFAAFRSHVEAHGLPTGALLIVLAAHAGGSFVSGFVCGLIARRPWYLAATILGVLWTCGGIAMLMMLPAPTWFAIADVVLYIPAALLGVKLGGAMTSRSSPQLATQ